jgi:hypothetical protein
VTHLTGSIPNGTPSIVAATGRYRHVTGTARISGAVSVLTIDGNTDTGPSFDCLWEVKLGDEDEDEDEEDKNDDEDD